MLRVPITQAKPGMQLALPVLQPKRPGVVLLHAGFLIDQHEINRMREIEIPEIWIQVPGLEYIAHYINPAMVNEHAELTRSLATSFDAIREQQFSALEFGEYKASIAGLVESIFESPRASIFVQELADRESDLIRHASSVCLISLLMGVRLDAYMVNQRRQLSGLQAKSVANLGLGAMLHDVGMLRISPEAMDRWQRVRDEKDPAWRQHVEIGFDMLQGHISPTAAAAVLHHHQKFDGTGFPTRIALDRTAKPLAGTDIHIFSRIIACADLFDRERHTLAGEVPVVRALSRMIHPPISRWVDPTVLRALLTVVPAYAPGTIVRLNSGHAAAVCNWFPDDPCRPSVLIMNQSGQLDEIQFSSHPVTSRAMRIGNAVRAAHLQDPTVTRHGGDVPQEGDRIDLKARPDLWITHAENECVEADNFYPQYPGELDLLIGGSTSIERKPLPLDDLQRATHAA